MKIRLLISLLFILGSMLSLTAQAQVDTISYSHSFGGNVYLYNGQILKFQQLKKMVKSCPEAKKTMNKAILHYNVAMVFAYTGGFFVGFPVGQMMSGGDVNYEFFAVGAGFIAIGMPFWYRYNKKSLEAVKIYNRIGVK